MPIYVRGAPIIIIHWCPREECVRRAFQISISPILWWCQRGSHAKQHLSLVHFAVIKSYNYFMQSPNDESISPAHLSEIQTKKWGIMRKAKISCWMYFIFKIDFELPNDESTSPAHLSEIQTKKWGIMRKTRISSWMYFIFKIEFELQSPNDESIRPAHLPASNSNWF